MVAVNSLVSAFLNAAVPSHERDPSCPHHVANPLAPPPDERHINHDMCCRLTHVTTEGLILIPIYREDFYREDCSFRADFRQHFSHAPGRKRPTGQ